MPIFEYDQRLIDDLSSRFDLRKPNADGLKRTVFELSQQDEPEQVVLDMATGVGKTYLLAALLEYAATEGVKNLLVVLPGKTVRTKTINNFTPGAKGFIEGAEINKVVITPQNFMDSAEALHDPNTVKLFLLNVQNLIGQDTSTFVAPGSARSHNLRTARPQETLGGSLLEYLADADDLFMVLDESHSYSESAKTWQPALARLKPAARVGLTATPDPVDKVIYRYQLKDAIEDQFVKQPVLALRQGGYRDNEEVGRLTDAKALLERKAEAYGAYEELNGNVKHINPIMLVSCRDTSHADEVAGILRGPELFGSKDAVALIHSKQSDTEIDSFFDTVQDPDSPIRAVVHVDMLSQGWDVHNVAVMVPARSLESQTLTEQMIGRGLRLPYGKYTGDDWIDTLDILSHEKVRDALSKHGLSGQRQVAEPEEPSDTEASDGCQDETTEVSDHEAGGNDPASGEDPDQEGTSKAISTEGLVDLDPDTKDSGDDSLTGTVAGLGGAVRAVDQAVDNPGLPLSPLVVKRHKGPKFFMFPSSIIEKKTQRLKLAALRLDDQWMDMAAAEMRDATPSTIIREKIVLTDEGPVQFTEADHQKVWEQPISEETAAKTIIRELKDLRFLSQGPEGESNRKHFALFTDDLLGRKSGKWTVARAEDGATELGRLLKDKADEVARQAQDEVKIIPVEVPVDQERVFKAGTVEIDQKDLRQASDLDRRTPYKDWVKGTFTAATFDAYATEVQIARILDRSPEIQWWHRLVSRDDAYIEYASNARYYPDFVAQDSAGRYWIIEGKSHAERDSPDVEAKKKATLRVIQSLPNEPGWEDPNWGYMIAYQDRIEKADSWEYLLEWSDRWPRRA